MDSLILKLYLLSLGVVFVAIFEVASGWLAHSAGHSLLRAELVVFAAGIFWFAMLAFFHWRVTRRKRNDPS